MSEPESEKIEDNVKQDDESQGTAEFSKSVADYD